MTVNMDQEKHKNASSFSVLEAVALEVESFFRDFRAAMLFLDGIDKAAWTFALVMFCSCFLPWFSPEMAHVQSGIDGFGTIHIGISVVSMMLVRKVSLDSRLGQNKMHGHVSRERLEPGRVGLIFLFLGALSTLTCMALLIHFGDLAALSLGGANVRFGFYVVLLSGMGISACGIGKFC